MRPGRFSLKRKKDIRSPNQKFILISEGENTEKLYFQALEKQFPRALFEINFDGGAGVPATIAAKVSERLNALKREKRSNSSAAKDQVWAIFDEDDHPNVQQSMQQCEASGGHVAYSNPCFEVWLILHFEDFNRSDDRHQVQRYYGNIDPTYLKNGSKKPNCEELIPNIEEAENRAEAIEQRRFDEGAPLGRPSTTVYKLTREIRKAATKTIL